MQISLIRVFPLRVLRQSIDFAWVRSSLRHLSLINDLSLSRSARTLCNYSETACLDLDTSSSIIKNIPICAVFFSPTNGNSRRVHIHIFSFAHWYDQQLLLNDYDFSDFQELTKWKYKRLAWIFGRVVGLVSRLYKPGRKAGKQRGKSKDILCVYFEQLTVCAGEGEKFFCAMYLVCVTRLWLLGSFS